ncbi:colanic acid biosynthesis glycosyltransferase WcaL [Serratia entomophila]|uniref:glycosyltransferase n=1 Tax=Serratia entomophila TaxID=42906 RepID=UPI00217B0FFD|nr:glycosyltransferase [Serratia entomophila]CAI1120993.1 colanic acid biosynthesis glycosyltransferase WcaL [Serratia entomophila]CAI1140581.1 colanic acid biosynthesis glycosyltransferase WcaL [Serratia entomophila]CAI1630383.1 colanic acid biosynthesis glycosyltransferase WcaL [Serratia entomophila]CAI2143951.1 colanic acid biosynthesis glycosyltransferase WcaL [Serratia entomophila]CAI2929919.1 colanic acid biosynthesis glycosyltransferase WcaL [Serratia entomophila]
MNKLHIINLEKMGGVERLFLQYINDTADGSNQVLCISSKVGEEIRSQMPEQKVTFANRLFNALPLRCPQFLRKYWLKSKIERANADVVIVWDLVPGLAAKPKRGKLIYYDHGCSWRYPKNHKTLRFFSMLDGVISASFASKRVMELRFGLPVPNPVVINRIKTPAGVTGNLKPLSSPIRIGTASRLVSLKGISVSLLMMQELLQRGHDVVLEVAGKGPDRAEFETLAARLELGDRVTFSGFQENVADFFNRTHIYMSTPITEPFGLSCMESLYFGIPVIFPLVDGQPEAVKDGCCGIGLPPVVSIEEHRALSGINVDFPHEVYDPLTDSLVTPKLLSHIDCADAVEKLLVTETYKKMSENAQRYPAEHFDYFRFKAEFDNRLQSFIA